MDDNKLGDSGENGLEILDNLPIAVYTCTSDGTITSYNKAAADLWEGKPERAIDTWCGFHKIFNSDGTPMAANECPTAVTIKTGIESTQEMIAETKSGRRINIMPYPKLIYDKSGNISGAINTILDITEKKQQNERLQLSEQKYRELSEVLEKKVEERTLKLKKSEERYHKMIEEVQDYAIILLDTEGNIMNWNKGAERIKGYNEKEIIGKNFRIFYLKDDRLDRLPEKLISQASRNGKAMHEGWRVRKDGTKFWGNIVITALHNEAGNVIGFSKVTRDLTERKIAEDQMLQDAKDIEFQNKQLEEYAYVASHDLQEPLRKIRIFTELVEENIDDKAMALRHLSKINSAAQRMTTLIKDVLNYSQLLKSGELFTYTDLNKVLENINEDFELLLEQKQGVIHFKELPVIKCIPVQIHQLFSNLINNSIKFSDKKPIIKITSETITNGKLKEFPELKPDHNYVHISIEDNGVGFDEEYAPQAFKMFQRLNSEKQGTGIGLALCKKIVENHEGYISVSSKPQVGSTFNIFLPIL